jgi:phosphoglycerate dehydrogenase-like enzyme
MASGPGLRILNLYPLPGVAIEAIGALPGVTVVTRLADDHTATASELADVEALFGELPDGDPAKAPRLRWMARAGAGVEDMDVPRLAKHGITITNSSGLHASSMGEHCLGAMLLASQRQAERVTLQRRHEWDRDAAWASPLRGSTVAVLGYGSIGREVARLAHAFGMRVLALKLRPGERVDHGFTLEGIGDPDGTIPKRIVGLDGLHGLLAEADYVVVSVPLTSQTRGFLGAAELAACRPGAWIVNVGRGPMIHEGALIAALTEGRLGGAYLDVFDEEPLPPDHPYWDTPNLYVTPHIAGVNSYERYWLDMGVLLEENTRRLVGGHPLLNAIDPARAY